MNTPSNVMPNPPVGSQAVTTAVIPATRLIYWSVLRELWEYRSIYLAPAGVAAVFLFAFLIGTIAGIWEKALRIDPSQTADKLADPYEFAAVLIMGIAFFVGLFYSLDCLHGERRDRSILFWKSLPVSDLTAVLSKASVPILILPLLSFAITVATQFIMLLLSSAVLLVSGLDVGTLWRQVPLLPMSLLLLYHVLTIHVLWYAPIYGWLLLVSAWARRVAFLWAALPLVAIGVIEHVAFKTSHFPEFLKYRMAGPEPTMLTPSGHGAMGSLAHLSPATFFSAPGLWIGLTVAAICLAATMRLRRHQGPI